VAPIVRFNFEELFERVRKDMGIVRVPEKPRHYFDSEFWVESGMKLYYHEDPEVWSLELNATDGMIDRIVDIAHQILEQEGFEVCQHCGDRLQADEIVEYRRTIHTKFTCFCGRQRVVVLEKSRSEDSWFDGVWVVGREEGDC